MAARTAEPWLVALYQAQYRDLVRLATLLVGDRGTAEEVVQDAFVAVHLARGRLRDKSRERAYLRSAVLNGARSALRKRAVRRRPLRADPRVQESPEAASLAGDDHRRVIAALRQLPDRQRECLVLRYYLDLSEADIATTLGISTGSVKTHASRGIAALARILDEEELR